MVTTKYGKEIKLIVSAMEGDQFVHSPIGNMIMCDDTLVMHYDCQCKLNGEPFHYVYADELRGFVIYEQEYLGLDIYPDKRNQVKYGKVEVTIDLEGDFYLV